MNLNVISFEDFGLVRVIRLGVENLPIHQAGHYANLQFGNHPVRPYSIANAPNGKYLEFHVKNGGRVGGSTYATTELKIGHQVICSGFGGNYTSVINCLRPLLLIAGGTGLAPMLSIADFSLNENPQRPITLFFGGRQKDDLYFDEPLREKMKSHTNFIYTSTLSEEKHDGFEMGLVGDIALEHPQLLQSRLYMAGPVDMIRSLNDKALAKGMSPDVIHSDLPAMDVHNK